MFPLELHIMNTPVKYKDKQTPLTEYHTSWCLRRWVRGQMRPDAMNKPKRLHACHSMSFHILFQFSHWNTTVVQLHSTNTFGMFLAPNIKHSNFKYKTHGKTQAMFGLPKLNWSCFMLQSQPPTPWIGIETPATWLQSNEMFHANLENLIELRLYQIHDLYGCFQRYWYPQIIHFNRVFHYKPSILGTPIFGNLHMGMDHS